MSAPLQVIGVGSPIVDRLAEITEEQLDTVPGEKGGMELVDTAHLQSLLETLDATVAIAPGGSAANTTFALARLGIRSAFLGKLGDDAEGDYYKRAFESVGGDCSRFRHCPESATARCLSLITPDSERTMRTDLGAAAAFSPREVSARDFDGCFHAHVEGYLLFNQELTEAVLHAAKTAGCTISLDLGSFEVVEAAGEALPGLLREYVDLVLANEDEAAAFCGDDAPEAGLKALSRLCELAAVKLGADGAWLENGGGKVHVPAEKIERVVDSTGAGDYWAAGFLYGYLRGCSLAECGRFGAILGGEVVRHVGADLPRGSWQRTLEHFDKLAA